MFPPVVLRRSVSNSMVHGATWRYQGNSRRVGFGGGREAAQGDELSVDVVKHVCPDFADICDPSTLLANSEP